MTVLACLYEQLIERETSAVAFDISLDRSQPRAIDTADSFEEFYEANATLLGRALALACSDDELARQSVEVALTKASQRWRRLASNAHQLGWVFEIGVEHADKTTRSRAPLAMNEATGGYVRGLELEDALAALPVHQRSALVAAHFLGWSDVQAALGTSVDERTVRTRRTRGLTFLAHHRRVPTEEIESFLVERFGADPENTIALPDLATVRKRGRRQTMRDRLGIAVGVLAIIVAGGALLQTGGGTDPVAVGPAPVSPPTTSSNWFPPVSDGDGGFVALEVSGGSRFVSSTDGIDWFAEHRWNSRAIDLRTEVTSFVRNGENYVVTIEAGASIRTPVPPRIAVSQDLREWEVSEIELDPLPEVPGLQSQYRVLAAATVGDRKLATMRIEETIDYRFHGIARSEACVEESTPTQVLIHLCDGETISIERPTTTVAADFLVASDPDGTFDTVPLPAGADPRSLTSSTALFSLVDGATGEVSYSADGRSWQEDPESVENRFVLTLGAADNGDTMVVAPDQNGWTAALVNSAGVLSEGWLPIELDPAAVWTEPDLAVGPAGWALFVSTSRPWERVDISAGWAVDTGDWIVSRQPDTDEVRLRAVDGSTTLRYTSRSDFMQTAQDETIELRDPGTGELLVEVTAAMIARSRQDSSDESGVQAQVFYSADGAQWRSVWETTEGTWFGSLAVGDSEILLSGAKLISGPISIPIE